MQHITFNMAQMHRHGSAFYDFLRLRKSFFVDHLKWDIPHDDDVEMDQYDNPQAHYSIVQNDEGEVVGGARVMSSLARWGAHTYMLRDAVEGRLGQIPPQVMGGVVASQKVWEVTRVVISNDLTRASERSECLSTILDGVVHVAARQGASELISLSPITMMRALRQLGFDAEKRGEPYWCDGDGRQYTVLSMPARPARPRVARPMPAGLPASTHRPQPMAVHAPQVA